MSKIIACVDKKGGVAKSITVKNLFVGLAMEGRRVRVILQEKQQREEALTNHGCNYYHKAYYFEH